MPRRLYLLGLAGALGLLAWRINRERAGSSIAAVGVAAGDAATIVSAAVYTPPKAAGPYLATIRAAEDRFGIPRNLLARLLEIESGYRPEVIDGRVKSATGATGIAQILRSTALQPGYGLRALKVTAAGLAPDDERCIPAIAIPWGAQYLRAMYDRTGSWRKATAAYNQGLGNVLKAAKASPANWLPLIAAEGQKYVANIADRLGVA